MGVLVAGVSSSSRGEMIVMRIHAIRVGLPTLVAACLLAACGAAPQPPAGVAPLGVQAPLARRAPPGAPPEMEAAAPAATPVASRPDAIVPAERMGGLWVDPLPGAGSLDPATGAIALPGPIAPAGVTAGSLAPIAPAGGVLVGSDLAGALEENILAFASRRDTGGGAGFDIFIYDRQAATVLALPGVNTGANEIHPRLSHNGEWLIYATDANGDYDIQIYDLRSHLIDTLAKLNTPFDELSPTVSDNGQIVAFTSRENGFRQLRLHDLSTGVTTIPVSSSLQGINGPVPAPLPGSPLLSWLAADILDPNVSADGRVVAFAVSQYGGARDIYLYDLATGALANPPFVNTINDERDPELSADGQFLLFASDRTGDKNIYMADLLGGVTDRLVLANSPGDEREPRFLGPSGSQVLFESNRNGNERLFIYDTVSGVLDTLPVAHEDWADDTLAGGAGPSIIGGFGRGGILDGFFGRRSGVSRGIFR